jgi:ABC-type transport system involved in multi-copper enzyme maturation permease subunit
MDLVPNVMQSIITALYVFAIVAMAIVTIVMIILRFFRNLLGDEGYLMFTLPVTREQHILSKLLAAVVWSLCSAVLIFLSILLLVGAFGGWDEIVKLINEAIANGIPIVRYTIVSILVMLINCVSSILMLYAAMAIGPNILKNRVGGSILAFIIIAIASSFASSGIMVGTMLQNSFFGMMMNPFSPSPSEIGMAVVDSLMVGTAIFGAVSAVVYWVLTQFMLKKKLNLA